MNNRGQRDMILTLTKIMIIRVKMIFEYFIILYWIHIEKSLINWVSLNRRIPRATFGIRFYVQKPENY